MPCHHRKAITAPLVGWSVTSSITTATGRRIARVSHADIPPDIIAITTGASRWPTTKMPI